VETNHKKIVGAILAAGGSTRFGSPKQLAKFGTKILLDLAHDALLGSQVDSACIVLGCEANHFSRLIEKKGTSITVIENSQWQDGMASSIRAATEFARTQEATHLLLLVCDQPFVTHDTVDHLLAMVESNDSSIVASRYGDTVGIPALFPASYFEQLTSLQGDKGAKSIIQKSENVVYFDFPEGNIDIDSPADLIAK